MLASPLLLQDPGEGVTFFIALASPSTRRLLLKLRERTDANKAGVGLRVSLRVSDELDLSKGLCALPILLACALDEGSG